MGEGVLRPDYMTPRKLDPSLGRISQAVGARHAVADRLCRHEPNGFACRPRTWSSNSCRTRRNRCRAIQTLRLTWRGFRAQYRTYRRGRTARCSVSRTGCCGRWICWRSRSGTFPHQSRDRLSGPAQRKTTGRRPAILSRVTKCGDVHAMRCEDASGIPSTAARPVRRLSPQRNSVAGS